MGKKGNKKFKNWQPGRDILRTHKECGTLGGTQWCDRTFQWGRHPRNSLSGEGVHTLKSK